MTFCLGVAEAKLANNMLNQLASTKSPIGLVIGLKICSSFNVSDDLEDRARALSVNHPFLHRRREIGQPESPEPTLSISYRISGKFTPLVLVATDVSAVWKEIWPRPPSPRTSQDR
jgi:hypothetical protein